MRTSTSLSCCLYLFGTIVASPCFSQDGPDSDLPDLGGYIEGPKWQEGNTSLPPYPQADHLLKLDIDRSGQRFNYFIDSKSIETTDSGVVRYTVVIESNSGSKNVLYEGIRCLTDEYRTYAYGTSSGEFSAARTSTWTEIRDTDVMKHRDGLLKLYLCSDQQISLKPTTILQRIRYPEDFQNSGDRDF